MTTDYFTYVDEFAKRWKPYTDELQKVGLDAAVEQTGGMIMCLGVRTDSGDYFLLGRDGGLPDDPDDLRTDGAEWGYDYYHGEEYSKSGQLPEAGISADELALAVVGLASDLRAER